MKSQAAWPLADAPLPAAVVAASGEAEAGAPQLDIAARARALAVPLVAGRMLSTGEPVLAHADGTADILRGMGAAPDLVAAAWLVHAADHIGDPERVIGQSFGESLALLVTHARKLVDLQRVTQGASVDGTSHAGQVERVRKMLLAFSRDLRVVLLRLASRLQTLRFHAQAKRPCPRPLALEAQRVFAPLAHRLGIVQVKWELEDLSFRFLDPEAYFDIARRLDERRTDREARVGRLLVALRDELQQAGIRADVQGRPKHLYSIWRKMRSKALGFDRVLDVIALRVITDDVPACYAALARVQARWTPVEGEFDDYIARPKANGYRSLHTVVQDDDGRPVEIQIRTREMHEHAEHGVAAHWVYKEAAPGKAAAAAGTAAERIAQARLVVLRQLLAWERDVSGDDEAAPGAAPDSGARAEARDATPAAAPADDRIYVLTPQAQLVELTAGATPIDFAYALHTELGHRCRGARVDGAMVPLDTPLANGQTIEIVAAKTGGPSFDWLNADLGYLRSARSRAKVRAWFNARQQAETIARGREAVEKLLQREGRTALKLDDLASQLGFRSAAALFEVVGKDELSLRSVETLLRPPAEARTQPTDEERLLRRTPDDARPSPRGGVLVVGVDSLLTSLARCCRPAPPDVIAGYVTRGKGVAVHRSTCSNLRELAARAPERVIPVEWGKAGAGLYPVDVAVEASDRQGLLRDVSEVFAREKVNVTGVKSQSVRDARGGTAFMTFTVEVADAGKLGATLTQVAHVPGVRSARRR